MPVEWVTNTNIIIRLCLAGLLGAVIGVEREKRGQMAGLRTHVILALGSALAMILSINLSFPNYDPTRMAAQVVSGIGFLGAGAILRNGMNVRGLTTATSLWTMAVVGMAVGAGYYMAASAATLISLVVLVVLESIERNYIQSTALLKITITTIDRVGLVNELRQVIEKNHRKITSASYTKNVEKNHLTIIFTAKALANDPTELLINELSLVDGVRKIDLSA